MMVNSDGESWTTLSFVMVQVIPRRYELPSHDQRPATVDAKADSQRSQVGTDTVEQGQMIENRY